MSELERQMYDAILCTSARWCEDNVHSNANRAAIECARLAARHYLRRIHAIEAKVNAKCEDVLEQLGNLERQLMVAMAADAAGTVQKT